MAIYAQIDDLFEQSQAYINLAVAYTSQGNWRLSSKALYKALDIKQELGDIYYQGVILNNLGSIYLNFGEYAKGEKFYNQSNVIWRKLEARLPEAIHSAIWLKQLFLKKIGLWLRNI